MLMESSLFFGLKSAEGVTKGSVAGGWIKGGQLDTGLRSAYQVIFWV